MCGEGISASTCYLLQVTNWPSAGWPGCFLRSCASLAQLCLCNVLCQRLSLFIHLNSKKLGQCVIETPKFFTFFLKSLPITIKWSLNLQRSNWNCSSEYWTWFLKEFHYSATAKGQVWCSKCGLCCRFVPALLPSNHWNPCKGYTLTNFSIPIEIRQGEASWVTC